MLITSAPELIDSLPDCFSGPYLNQWIKKTYSFCQDQKKILKDTTPWVTLEWKTNLKEGFSAQQNNGEELLWRKWVSAIFCADQCSYDQKEDQVDLSRLLFVVNQYPQGFRVWFFFFKNQWWPVGYTGWYPMSPFLFHLLKSHPESMGSLIENRYFFPLKNELEEYLYIFNFSVWKDLKKTFLTRLLLKELTNDLKRKKARGWCCIGISSDTARVTDVWKMNAIPAPGGKAMIYWKTV